MLSPDAAIATEGSALGVWPARAFVQRVHAFEAAVSTLSFVVLATTLLLADGWSAYTRRPDVLGSLVAFFAIVLASLAARRSILASRRAAAAGPLPDDALLRAVPAVEGGRVCARLLCVYTVLLTIRLFLPSLCEPLTLLTTGGVALCATVGPAVGTVVALRRYERSLGRTLFFASDAAAGRMFWRASPTG